ncbi:MAG: RNA-binding transcriptional accessory protein [Lachnospiraceae bacterium]|nr:RNA-binding transcriptional accessory protein [Lachnospiraceae bacterium]
MNIAKVISKELAVLEKQVDAAIKLLDEGSTVPFISRYRKEVTGGLNDEKLRTLYERLVYLRELDERKETILASIDEQGKLTKELKKQIDEAMTMVSLEDLYRPYKPKKKTRASVAKAKGLEPLAETIWNQKAKQKIETYAKKYIDKEKGVETIEDAIEGSLDIIAEMVSDVADYRTWIREYTISTGLVHSEAKDAEVKSNYEIYYNYTEGVAKIPPHRILAINRGENEKVLKVKIEVNRDDIIKYLSEQIIKEDNKFTNEYLVKAIEDSYDRLIAPSIENEVRGILTDRAEDTSMDVFSKNLTQILMQAPIEGKVVLGWDPAFRTGCKLAVCDATGKVLATTVIYPTEPTTPEKMEASRKTLKKLIDDYGVDIISVGNGTASRESEMFIVDFLKREKLKKVKYVIVNEAGASVYSASALATEEFPKFDVGQRSAASIARRLQDPLAELVKIDPKSIGVGQYQHDMNQKRLSNTLTGVVETCVNKVGVDLNTASYSLLSYVSGINKNIAKNIVSYREKKGRFNNRQELLSVDKLGAKAYEQSAGFLRITGGDEPLDRTGVHPESYEATNKLLKDLKFSKKDLVSGNFDGLSSMINDYDAVAKKLKIGVETLKDIVLELEKPGRDPREDAPKPILRSDVLSMEDLKEGMILKGTVRNCIDFGVFVDIGVHQDGLVHISQIADRYIKHPLEAVSIGDVVDVKVLSVDLEKKRISLTMKIDSGDSK